MTEPKWSTGQPSVALTHIFCGQINGDVAEGFHSRPGNRNPSCAKAYNYQKYRDDQDGLRCYVNERVYDAKRSLWIDRPVPSTGYFCFFPQAWTIADTVRNIQNIYAHCEAKDRIKNNRICGRNYMGQGFDVIVFLQKVGLHNRVVSSFATPPNKVNCNVKCPLNKMGGRKTEKMEFVRYLLSMIEK